MPFLSFWILLDTGQDSFGRGINSLQRLLPTQDNTTNKHKRHPCPQRNSNLWSQQPRGQNLHLRSVILKLWSADYRWSAAIRKRFRKKKHWKNCIRQLKNEKQTHIHVCDKPSLLADLQQKVGELVIAIISSCTKKNFYKMLQISVYKKCGYCNFDHRYNVSPSHLHAIMSVGNFKKVVHVCADRLWSGQRLPKVGETLAYTVRPRGLPVVLR
jgi:hypothetical protein